MDNTQLTIIDENGNEYVMQILLTFDDDKNNHFVLVYDPEDEEGNVYAYLYDDEGNLNEVEDPDMVEMCAEVLSAFEEEEEPDGKA
ncbi:MAG: DUF1292 domain-containing protein [Solobacterium sp.]|nr:DUF1292 domain-containing protein [Solobacterium sp.]MCR5450216.1 DUF1292 domain-containing protein [Solobacterium sp.]MDO4194287.1 DUF1292 domain-containing protein [Erysipelotrichaceae bacterium]